ncbi:AP2 domain-containing protein [Agrobacterium vitis]|nr:AP2 domain-containing protein [Agrobacterium vitis]
MIRSRPKHAPEERFHDESMYAIHRLDIDKHRQDAWMVNLSRGGKSIHMTFSDSTYGGKDQALEIAQAYRDAVLRVVPPLTNNDMRMLVRKNRSEGSSVPGVYFIGPTGAHKSGIWMARIEIALDDNTPVPAGKRRRRQFTRTFNVSKFGYETARRMAEEERIRMVLAVENGEDPALRSPQALKLHEKLTRDDNDD